MEKIAILVDGGFYQKKANYIFGEKNGKDRADELIKYCHRHLPSEKNLYRIFYYDCKPSEKQVYHPLTQKTIDLKKTALYSFYTDFFKCINRKRKVALSLGEFL